LLFACAKSNERQPRHRAALRIILIKDTTSSVRSPYLSGRLVNEALQTVENAQLHG
jgi:hypothetical protein